MPSRFAASRFAVAVTIAIVASGHPAGAADTPAEASYATVLRTINPHLQMNQSLVFARSLLADAQRANLDPNLVMALVTVESSWRPAAVSVHGARGLGQLMPSTAARLGVDAWDPSQNLRGASSYLRTLVDRFAGRGVNAMRDAIGAYNSGPLAVERSHGVLHATTQRYVSKVLAQWRTLSARVARTFGSDPAPALAAADERQWLTNADASALPATAPAVVPEQQP